MTMDALKKAGAKGNNQVQSVRTSPFFKVELEDLGTARRLGYVLRS
jgi:hypothetical protein